MGELSPESRGRLWWQLAQMSCPRSESDSHLSFIKAQLKLLYQVTLHTIDSYKASADAATNKRYRNILHKIFRNKQLSFTALNVKSLQCAYLLSIMTKHIPNPDRKPYGEYIYDRLYDYLSAIDWTNYDSVLRLISHHEPDEEEYDLKWLVIEDEFDEGSCIPSMKNKAVIVLLGELTLYELVWSLAQDVYFIGLIPGLGFADGALMHPVSFLAHDLDHMHDRLLLCEEDTLRRAEVNARVLHFLAFIADKTAAIQQTCLMFLFLYMHHEIECKESILLEDTLRPTSGPFRPGGEEDEYVYLPDRFLRQNDLQGFLPVELRMTSTARVFAWLRTEWRIFIEEWNACFADPVIALERRRTSSDRRSRYRAATLRNASLWNAMQKRRTTRKMKRTTSVKK